MLNVMRRNSRNWVIKIALSIIVLVFMFWGVGTFKSGRLSNVASVNGDFISLEEYQKEYKDVISYYKDILNTTSFDEGIVNNFKKITLNRLINHKLLLQEADNIGLYVTDLELIMSIQKNPLFLSKGAFDISRYNIILSNLGVTSNQFEKQTREFLLIKKFIEVLYGFVSISDIEISNWYNWENTLLSLSYVFFDPKNCNDIVYDSKEIYDYFEKNKEHYRTSSMKKIRYVMFDSNNYLNEKSITEFDIIQYFNSNRGLFINEKTVNVSHILLKVDNSISIEKQIQVEEHAKNISKMAKEGRDFNELVMLYSECSSKEKGGELGDITYDSVVEPFAKRAFEMSVGEISYPIKTRFGWHIIKLNYITESAEASLDECRENIRLRLKKANADVFAYNKAVDFLETCMNQDDLVKNANLYNIDILETDWFSIGGPIEFSEHSSQINSIISSMQIGQISDVQELEDRYIIIQLIDKKDSIIPKFEDVKSKLIINFEYDKKKEKAYSDANIFIESIQEGKTFEEVAKKYNYTIQDTGFFARGNLSYNSNLKIELLKEGFNLVREGDITKKPIEGKQGFFVACLTDKIPPETINNLSDLRDEKNNILKLLISKKQTDILSKVLQKLRSSKKIILEDGYKLI